MNPFGDGSDGALSVLTGTANLALNTKHQFTTVNVASGATLSTLSTTGSVLYILAKESITINGIVNVSNKVNRGKESWSVTIDGITYTSPGVANGSTYTTSPQSGNGYGAGGKGTAFEGATGGGSSSGGANIVPGYPGSTSRFAAGSSMHDGQAGSNSGGGSGAYYAITTGGARASAYAGIGADTHGGNGGDGSTSIGGSNGTAGAGAGGGGGGGGLAGRAGVHVVLKAPVIIINGTIITSGTNGGNGGNGGRTSFSGNMSNSWGDPGLGGGGGFGGNVAYFYSETLTNNSTLNLAGGAGGLGGYGGTGFVQVNGNGESGAAGSLATIRIAPTASFTSQTSAFRSAPVAFTNTSTGGDSWLWNFGDGTTSTVKNPTKTYTTNGIYTVSLTATNTSGSTTETKTSYMTVTTKTSSLTLESGASGGGTGTTTRESGRIDIIGGGRAYGLAYVKSVFQSLPQKDYEYRVFDENFNYLSTWVDVSRDTEFNYTHKLNESPSELNVSLARSPETRAIILDMLRDNNNSTITDENGDPILVQTETANSVGDGTDVRENLNVEVYAFYGGYEPLQDQFGDDILDENNEALLAQYGAPNGKRVYSGYIADYELLYGNTKGVNVIIVPHAAEMSQYIFKNNEGKEEVKYLNTDPIIMARDAINNYRAQGGYINYTFNTMPLSGTSTDYDFKLQTTRESVDKTVDLLPSGYSHYVDPGENLQYILPRAETAHHVFYYEKHITDMRLRKSITQIKNKVYFIGGEYDPANHPGEDLFVYKENAPSIASIRPGLDRISDSRVTKQDSAEILIDREIEEFKAAHWRTTVVISDAVYDIETIKLGQMVGFKNFGDKPDSLLLQIVEIQRSKHAVTLILDMALPSEAKRLEELKRNILNEQIRNIGDTPS